MRRARRQGDKAARTYSGFVYYLGGVFSVLSKIEATYGIRVSAAETALLHIKAAMRDKFHRAKKGRKNRDSKS